MRQTGDEQQHKGVVAHFLYLMTRGLCGGAKSVVPNRGRDRSHWSLLESWDAFAYCHKGSGLRLRPQHSEGEVRGATGSTGIPR